MKTDNKTTRVVCSVLILYFALAAACLAVSGANPPTIFFSYPSDVSESAGAIQIHVRLTASSSEPVSVDYGTTNGTAIAGTHYGAQSGTLNFAPGETEKIITIPIYDNPEVNPARYFQLGFERVHGASFEPYMSQSLWITIVENEQPNLVDGTFQPGTGVKGYDDSTGEVKALLPQADGKVIMGGDFNSVAGNLRKGVARLNADGSPDTNFNYGAGADGKVYALALQGNGQILIGGSFLTVNSQDRTNIARLNADGTVDDTFRASVDAEGAIACLLVQPDGSILVGGNFRKINGSTRRGIARLLFNGNLDSGFQAPGITNLDIQGMALLPDGKVMVVGNPTNVLDYQFTGPRILRLNSDGSIDPAFHSFVPLYNDPFNGLRVQEDGKVIVYGHFTYVPDFYRGANIVRLNADGTPEMFAESGVNIRSLIVQADGGILAGGGNDEQFDPDSGYRPRVFFRLHADLSEDYTLPAGVSVDHPIKAMAMQPDGKFFIGGAFTSVDNLYRVGIARIDLASVSGNTIQFKKVEYTGSEEAGTAKITIIRTGNSASSRTITFSTEDLTARNGIDYVGQTNVITFAPLEVEKTISLPLLDDGEVERDELVALKLSNPSSGVEGGLQSTAILTIEQEEWPVLVDTSFNPGTGANRKIYTMARQPNGKIVIGGQFTRVNGIARNYIARLNEDGTVDPTFDPGAGPNSYVRALVIQPDGKVVIGGEFRLVGGVAHPGIARLNADGSPDTSFMGSINGYREVVNALALQSDGKIVAAGNFYAANSQPCYDLARFQTNGALDLDFVAKSSFKPSLPFASVALQSDGRILAGCYYHSFLMRFQPNGFWDTNFIPPMLGVTNFYNGTYGYGRVKALQVLPDNRIVVGGLFRGPFKNIVRLGADGALDPTFNPGAGANNSVNAIGLDADGKLLIGGEFFRYNEVASRRLARLNADGSLDLSFFAGKGANDEIQAILVQPDHKYVLGGEFSALNGINIDHITRIYGYTVPFNSVSWSDTDLKVKEKKPFETALIRRYGAATNTITVHVSTADITAVGGQDYVTQNATITLGPLESVKSVNLPIIDDGLPEEDEQFQVLLGATSPGLELGFNNIATVTIHDNETPLFRDATLRRSDGPYGAVNAVAIQTDGKFLIGGLFTGSGGRMNLMRMNPDGSVDLTFGLAGADNEVRAIALQPDGQSIVGGAFTHLDSSPATYIARLSSAGVIDESFAATTNLNSQVRAILLQPDQKILIGGNFTMVGTNSRNRIARLMPNGTLDSTFDPGAGADDRVRAIVRQPDGKVLVAGRFTHLNGILQKYIGRLNENGTVDAGFVADPNNEIRAIALQADGKILIGGEFNQIAGATRYGLARLNPNGTLDPTFQTALITNFYSAPFIGDIKVQPDGKILIGGLFSLVDGFLRPGIARLTADGSLDHSLFSELIYYSFYGTTVNAIGVQADGNILLGGNLLPYGSQGLIRILPDSVNHSALEIIPPRYNEMLVAESTPCVTYTVRRTGNVAGSTTVAYVTGGGSALPGADYAGSSGSIYFAPFETEKELSIAILDDDLPEADEKLFLSLNNPSANVILNGPVCSIRIVDNERPGSRDTSFDAHLSDSTYLQVTCVAVQPDTNILVAGTFIYNDGRPTSSLVRLRPDGSPDLTFAAQLDFGFTTANKVALEPDGKILFTDGFLMLRLNVDGSSDESFSPINIFGRPVLVQPDGKIICHSAENQIIRINMDGLPDELFQPIDTTDLLYSVISLAMTPEGNLLVGADTNILVYRPDGTLLTQWSVPLNINTLLVEPGGSILVGGQGIESGKYTALLRISGDGTPDSSFSPVITDSGAGALTKIVRQPDGKLVVIGWFKTVNGTPRFAVARLHSDGSLDTGFDTGFSLQILADAYDSFDNPSGAFYQAADAAYVPSNGIYLGGGTSSGLGDTAALLVRLNGDRPFQLHGPNQSGGGQIQLRVDTVPGAKVVIESSSNLPHWTAVSTNIADGFYIPYGYPVNPSGSQFYRARQLP